MHAFLLFLLFTPPRLHSLTYECVDTSVECSIGEEEAAVVYTEHIVDADINGDTGGVIDALHDGDAGPGWGEETYSVCVCGRGIRGLVRFTPALVNRFSFDLMSLMSLRVSSFPLFLSSSLPLFLSS